jgi:Leucine-rich repeat (LRR) protein
LKLFNHQINHQININKYKKTETLVLKNGLTNPNPIPKRLPIGLENIKRITFRDCYFTELPDNLPNNLEELYCINNYNLKKLPDNLPNNLEELYFELNKNLKTLPDNLPNNLKKLYCSNNQELDISINLPNNLKELYYMFNCYSHNINKDLKKLPNILPKDLEILICKGSMIKKLPDDLPTNLKKLDCSVNLIKKLPNDLPTNLKKLDCSVNLIEKLPELPTSLEELYCDLNHNLSLNIIPDNLKKIQIDENQFYKFKDLLVKHIANENHKLHEIIIHYTKDKWDFTQKEIINIKKKISVLNQEFKEIDGNVKISISGSIKNYIKVGGKKNNNNVSIKKVNYRKLLLKIIYL